MKSRTYHFSFLFLTAMVLQGCISSIAGSTISVPSTSEMAPEDFATQIKKLREERPSLPNRFNLGIISATHRELVRLYLSPRNPQRDTVKAASELEQYIEINPEGKNRDDAENILAILQEISEQNAKNAELQKKLGEARSTNDSARKKNSRLKKLTSENASLRKRQKELLADNKKLEMTIEKLKILDLNLEKKRKTFR